jgi:hypothetical protein
MGPGYKSLTNNTSNTQRRQTKAKPGIEGESSVGHGLWGFSPARR